MTTTKVPKTNRGLGQIGGLSTSDSITLQKMFPASPLDSMDVAKLMKLLVDGVVVGNVSVGNYDLDYKGKGSADPAPTLEKFIPDVTSPGPGSINPADQPPNPDDSVFPSSGMGDTTSPSKTADIISQQEPKEHP